MNPKLLFKQFSFLAFTATLLIMYQNCSGFVAKDGSTLGSSANEVESTPNEDSQAPTIDTEQTTNSELPNTTATPTSTTDPDEIAAPADDTEPPATPGLDSTSPQTITPPIAVETKIHACFSFNLIDKIKLYVPPNLKRVASERFTDLKSLQARIDSKSDHAGAVYQLAGGQYNIEGSTGLRIYNKKNLIIYSDPSEPAILNGNNTSNFGVHIKESTAGATNNIDIIGLEITKTRFHSIFTGSDSNEKGGSNIYIAGNKLYDVANTSGAAITVRNTLGPVTIEANDISRVDTDFDPIRDRKAGGARGEAIYVGQGNNFNNFSENVSIIGNKIHDLTGEAIDIKRNSKNIKIEYNHIENIKVYSQGAITLGLDARQPQNFASNTIVSRNIIKNVTSLAFDGNAIVVAYDSLIKENLIFDINSSHAIDVYNDATGPNKIVNLENNIIWNYKGLPVRENIGNGNGGANNPFNIVRTKNIVQNNSKSGECLGDRNSFVGDLKTYTDFNPK